MENYISLFLINLVLDFANFLLLTKVFHLNSKKFEILIIMIFSLSPQIMYVFFNLKLVYFALLKASFYLFASLFLVESYSARRIFAIFGFAIFLMFSVYGFSEFYILFVRSVASQLLNISLGPIYCALSVFLLVLYIFLLYILFSKLAEHKKFNSLLSKVSFSLFGRHIEITGLIDTGNSLYDTKTRKPTIIVPLSVVKKYISTGEYSMLDERRYFGLNVASEIEYETVGGQKKLMPIVDIGEVLLERDGKKERHECVLGIVKESFSDKRFECLLHREFI